MSRASVTTGSPVASRTLASIFKAFEPQALKAVGGGARLEGPTTQEMAAAILDDLGDAERLLETLHRTGTGDDQKIPTTDRHTTDLENRVLGPKFPRHELVGVRDLNDLEHAGQRLEQTRLDNADIARNADGRPLGTGDCIRLQTVGLDPAHHALDLIGRGIHAHDYEHKLSFWRGFRAPLVSRPGQGRAIIAELKTGELVTNSASDSRQSVRE